MLLAAGVTLPLAEQVHTRAYMRAHALNLVYSRLLACMLAGACLEAGTTRRSDLATPRPETIASGTLLSLVSRHSYKGHGCLLNMVLVT